METCVITFDTFEHIQHACAKFKGALKLMEIRYTEWVNFRSQSVKTTSKPKSQRGCHPGNTGHFL